MAISDTLRGRLGEKTADSGESRIKRRRRLWDLQPAGPFGYEAKTFLFAQASLSWVSCQLQLKQL